MGLKKKTKKALPYSILASLFNLLISLFGMVYLVRYLEGNEYGILAILGGLPLLLRISISFGYGAYITRFVPKIESNHRVGSIVWNIVFRRIALAILISAILVFLFDFYSDTFGLKDYYKHFLTYQLGMVSRFGFLLITIALNARFMQKQNLFISLFYQLLRLSCILYGVNTDQEFLFFITGFAIIEFVNLLVSGITFTKKHVFPPLIEIIKPLKQSQDERSYRRISYINNLGTSFLGTDVDRYLLGALSTNVQVAVYALATNILKKLLTFYPLKMFMSIAEPAFYSKFDSTGKNSDLQHMFQFIYTSNNVVGFLFFALFYPLGKDLLSLVFSKPYVQDAYWPLVVFLLFIIFYSIPLGMVAKALRKPRFLLIAKVSVIANLLLGIPLASKYGALGMAIATAFSVVLKNVIIYFLIYRDDFKLRIPWLSTVKTGLNAVVTIAIIILARGYIDIPIIVFIPIGVISYMILLKINPVFNNEQKTLIYKLLPKKLHPAMQIIL